MYIFHNGQFTIAKPGMTGYEKAVKEIFFPGLYDFVVFEEGIREHGLLHKTDIKRTRMLYNEENMEDRFEPGKIVTVFQRATEKGIAFIEHFKTKVYISRLGFLQGRDQHWLTQAPNAKALSEQISCLTEFSKERRVLFYGGTKHAWRSDILKTINACVVQVDIKMMSLFEYMRKHRCCAVLGLDGASIGCHRDWEVAMAALPAIRITNMADNIPYVNPCGNYLTIHRQQSFEEALDLLTHQVSHGKIAERLWESKKIAEAVTSDEGFAEAADCLSLDHEFFCHHIVNGRKSISHFVEKASSVSDQK
jgi:hypothetical protein